MALPEKEWLTISEAAKRLKISDEDVESYIEGKHLKAYVKEALGNGGVWCARDMDRDEILRLIPEYIGARRGEIRIKGKELNRFMLKCGLINDTEMNSLLHEYVAEWKAKGKDDAYIVVKVRIPDESGHHSGGKAATVPTGIRPAFRSDCGHHSGAIRPG